MEERPRRRTPDGDPGNNDPGFPEPGEEGAGDPAGRESIRRRTEALVMHDLDATSSLEAATSDDLFFNGLSADGGYLLDPMSPAELAALAAKLPFIEPMAVMPGVDVDDLGSAGWGVVTPEDGLPGEVREAIRPLLERRQMQADDLYHEMTYRHGETKRDFLARHQAGGAGPVAPERMPYYLLLIGDPVDIPFGLQYQLDTQHAVGRIWFDQPAGYSAYAQAVLAAEDAAAAPDGESKGCRSLVFFSVENPDDPATALSARELVPPLAAALHTTDGWRVEIAADATRQGLRNLFCRKAVPRLLFTASHGIGFRPGSERQRPFQGALVCADWPGPKSWPRPIPREHYFAAEDVPRGADLTGSLVFHFACYGAGTPRFDAFSHRKIGPPEEVAERAFIAALPRRLLEAGAVGVFGHVERAWGASFVWDGTRGQPRAFEATLKRLMQGDRLGAAAESLNQRHAELAVDFMELMEEIRARDSATTRPTDPELGRVWTARNDARSWILLGDPAARVSQSGPAEELQSG